MTFLQVPTAQYVQALAAEAPTSPYYEFMPPPPVPPALEVPGYLEAYRLSIATDFVVGSLSVFIWDLLYNLGNDYRLLRMHGINIPSAIYLLSRISTLGFALMGAIVLTMPISNCHLFSQGILALYGILICTTMLLSYFRVCAVWNKNRYITGVFLFLWLISVGGSLTIIKGLPFFHILGSPYCDELVINDIVVAAIFMPTINHFLVFIATMYGICKNHFPVENSRGEGGSKMRTGYRMVILGDTLPEFSKAILQASQLCYLVAVLSGVTAIVWFYVYASDPGYRLAIFVPYSVIANIMFSWVFRSEKLWVPSNPFGPKATGRNTISAPQRADNIELGAPMARSIGVGCGGNVMQIEVSKVVEYKADDASGDEHMRSVGTVDFLDFRVDR